jgi:hypothetical protein
MKTLGTTEAQSEASQEARVRAILAKPYWDYEEAALVLNIEVKTLRNMKWKREITFTTFGRKIYLCRDVILREMKGNMVLCPATARGGRGRTAVGVA